MERSTFLMLSSLAVKINEYSEIHFFLFCFYGRVTRLQSIQQSNGLISKAVIQTTVLYSIWALAEAFCSLLFRFCCVLWAAGKWIFDLNTDFWLTETGSPWGFACIQLNPHSSWWKKNPFLLLLQKSKSRALCFLMERVDVTCVNLVFA